MSRNLEWLLIARCSLNFVTIFFGFCLKFEACFGDYGGPLVSFETGEPSLIGIVSWGDRCGLPGFPGVYSKVVAAREWIHSYAGVP